LRKAMKSQLLRKGWAPQTNLFCALRCIASQQAKNTLAGSSCARAYGVRKGCFEKPFYGTTEGRALTLVSFRDRVTKLLCLSGLARLCRSGSYQTVEMLLELRQQRVGRLCADRYCLLHILAGQVGLALSFKAIGQAVIDVG